MKRTLLFASISMVILFGSATAKPVADFSELDRVVPAELKEKNTPGQ